MVFDFSEHVDEFIDKDAPLDAIILDYYVNFVVYFANMFSPLFTFIAVIYFTSKMAYDTEIIAILSSGVSFRRMMFPYFVSAAIIGSFSFMLSNYIIPPSNKVRLEFTNTYIKNKFLNKDRDIHRQIHPGEYIYMSSYDASSNTGYKFTLEKFQDGALKSKLTSRYIRWDKEKKKWGIHDYFIRNIENEKESLESGRLKDTTLNFGPAEFSSRTNIVEAMNLPQLNHFIKEQTLRGDSNIEAYKIEKYKRIANPFSTFILTLIGVSLASRKIRGGMGLHLGLGLLISFTYILFMQISTVFATNGNMNPLLAVWLPNIMFSVVAIFIYRNAPK